MPGFKIEKIIRKPIKPKLLLMSKNYSMYIVRFLCSAAWSPAWFVKCKSADPWREGNIPVVRVQGGHGSGHTAHLQRNPPRVALQEQTGFCGGTGGVGWGGGGGWGGQGDRRRWAWAWGLWRRSVPADLRHRGASLNVRRGLAHVFDWGKETERHWTEQRETQRQQNNLQNNFYWNLGIVANNIHQIILVQDSLWTSLPHWSELTHHLS